MNLSSGSKLKLLVDDRIIAFTFTDVLLQSSSKAADRLVTDTLTHPSGGGALAPLRVPHPVLGTALTQRPRTALTGPVVHWSSGPVVLSVLR